MGFIILGFLDYSIEKAKWLAAEEKQRLAAELTKDRSPQSKHSFDRLSLRCRPQGENGAGRLTADEG